MPTRNTPWPAGTPCWMRQMSLGPGPEFIVVADTHRTRRLPGVVLALRAAVLAD